MVSKSPRQQQGGSYDMFASAIRICLRRAVAAGALDGAADPDRRRDTPIRSAERIKAAVESRRSSVDAGRITTSKGHRLYATIDVV
jgi:hypothetical protein